MSYGCQMKQCIFRNRILSLVVRIHSNSSKDFYENLNSYALTWFSFVMKIHWDSYNFTGKNLCKDRFYNINSSPD